MPIPSPTEFLETEAPDVNSLVDDAAARHGVDPNLAHSVMQTESGGRTDAVSPKGAVGPMQLMPETARGLGVDPHDPAQNIEGGVKLLKQLTDKYGGDFKKAAAAYNAGPGAVDKAGGVPAIPETQNYVKKIYDHLEQRLKDPANFPAMVSPPNIPLQNRPEVKNPDGSSSTVSTITIEEDGKGVLLPTIINGKRVDEKTAIQHYKDTGESLGVFKTEKDADEFDKKMHTIMGWNGPAGGSQAAWQASAPQPAVKHGIPSPSEFLDDPLNADISDPSKLPSQEEYDHAHQTFMQRARAAFSQGVTGAKDAASDLLQNPSHIIPAPLRALPGMVQDAAPNGLLRPLQDAMRPPTQFAEPEPTSTAGKIAQGVGGGITRTAESLTTPENIALMIGTEGVGLLPKIGAMLPRTISGYFSARMFKDAYDKIPEVRDAIHKGDVKGAAQAITEGVSAGVLGGAAAYHALASEGVPRGTSDSAKVPSKVPSDATPGTLGDTRQTSNPAETTSGAGVSKRPTPSEFLAGENNGPPSTAAESAQAFQRHGKTYAELFEDLADKDKAREASAAGAAAKPPEATIPSEGTPEGVSRALDARERLSQHLTGQPFNKLNNPDRMAVDELISEGFGQAAQPKKGFRAAELEGAGPDLLEGSGPADVVRMPKPRAADQVLPRGAGAEAIPFQQNGGERLPSSTTGPRGTEEQPLVTEVARPGTEAPAMNAGAEAAAAAEAGAARRKEAGITNFRSDGATALKPDLGDVGGKRVAQLIDRTQTLKPDIAETLAAGSTRVNAKGGVETLTEVPVAKIREAPRTAERPEGNVMYPDKVEEYRQKPSPVAPELRQIGDQFQIYEGHHRIAGAIARGDKSVLAWTSKPGADGLPEVTAPRPNYSVEHGKFVVHEETGAPAMRVDLTNPDSVRGGSALLRHMGEDHIADQLEAAGGLKAESKTGSEGVPSGKSIPERPVTEAPRQVEKELDLPARGKSVSVAVPGSPAAYPARYSIREAADIRPSHNPFSFGKNPEFEHANDRDYESAGNAARVVEQAKAFNPDYLTTDSPTAEHGAPVIDKRGNVLGGNSRAMTLARVYAEGGDHAAAYRRALAEKADSLGLNPKQIETFKEPVLVRELSGSHDAQKAITDFNKKGAAELSPEERAVSDGKRMSAETVKDLAGRLGESQEGATLADALRGEDGAGVVNRLVADGVFTKQEANGMVDARGHLTPEAKSRIAKALVGRLFSSPAEFRQAPPTLRTKLERIAPQILRVEGRPGWAITKQIREAVGIVEEMRVRKVNFGDLASQQELGGSKREFSPEGRQLAETLAENPRNAEYAFRRYANDEALSRPGGQGGIFEPPSRQQAFVDAFGDSSESEPLVDKRPAPEGDEPVAKLEELRHAVLLRKASPALALSQFSRQMEQRFPGLTKAALVKLFTLAKRIGSDERGSVNLGELAKWFEESALKSGIDALKPLGSRVGEEGLGAGKSLMKLISRAGDLGEVHAGQMLVRLADVRINSLDRGQRAELLDQLEGRAKSTDPRVIEVAKVMRGITDELAGVASATGVEIRTKRGRRPFAQLDDYFPHILRNAEALSSGPVRRDVIDNLVRQGIKPNAKEAGAFVDDWVTYLQSGKRGDSVLQHLVDSGQAKDKAEALAKLQRFRSNIQRHGSLEYARELNLPFYDPDPVRVLPYAAATGAKRLAQIAEFGQDHQRINQEILKISEHGGNADFARKSIDKILGVVTDGDTAEARVSRFLRAAETMKLGLSAIPNATQGVMNSMLAADAPSVALGFREALSKRGRRLAIESGAAIEPVLAEAHKELGGGRMVDRYLKMTGFSQTEQFNRATAANVGAIWAKKNLSILIDKPSDTKARARLEELGVDADRAIARGSLTQEERLMAAKKFSDITQFRSRPEDLPAFASTPLGRVAFQFKSFAYNQARLIAKETVGELQSGNVGRGLRTTFVVATLFPAAGELVRLLRGAITGHTQEFEDNLSHYLGALGSAGTLGILQDAFNAAGNRRSLEFIAGPAAADAANIGNILGNSDLDATEKAAALKKFAIQRFAGPARRLFPDQ